MNLPETNLPKMEYENEDLMPLSVEEIENYAMGLRKAWGLGVGPIDNLMVEVQKMVFMFRKLV